MSCFCLHLCCNFATFCTFSITTGIGKWRGRTAGVHWAASGHGIRVVNSSTRTSGHYNNYVLWLRPSYFQWLAAYFCYISLSGALRWMSSNVMFIHSVSLQTMSVQVNMVDLNFFHCRGHCRQHIASVGHSTTGGVAALSVEYRTCNREVVGSSLSVACGVETLGKFLTPVCLCSPSSTSWYRPKGNDALRLGSKGRYGKLVCGWQVKLCDPLVTHGPYLSALEVQHHKALYKSTFTLLYFTWLQRPTVYFRWASRSHLWLGSCRSTEVMWHSSTLYILSSL